MGLFERRCMITGVPTGFAGGIALVPLLEVSDTFRPACLPIWGTYDGYGGLTGILEGPHSLQCEKVFQQLMTQGLIVVDWGALGEEPGERNLEEFIGLLSRSMIEGARAVTCTGHVLVFAVLSFDVAEEILTTRAVEDSPGVDVQSLVHRAFGSDEPASSVFRGLAEGGELPTAELCHALLSFIALDDWLKQHDLRWAPAQDAGQCTPAEAIDSLAMARRRFADEPSVLRGLEPYEADLRDRIDG